MNYTNHYRNKAYRVTKKIVRVEEVIVPDLHSEAWRKVKFSLVQTIEVLLEMSMHNRFK